MILQRLYDYNDRPRGQQYNAHPYGWAQAKWNGALQAEFAAYRNWRISTYIAQRPKRLRQRVTTFNKTISLFENYFGYLVNEVAIAPSNLYLRYVAEPDLIQGYVNWHSTRRVDGISRYMVQSVGLFARIARYYLSNVTPAAVLELDRLRQSLDPDTRRDKQAAWNSLATLEEIGVAEYPGMPALAQAHSDYDKVLLAVRAQRSLLFRLVIRRPLRSRNLREMLIGRNLIRDGQHWRLEFRGTELKVGKLRGQPNVYRVPFPGDLEDTLDEFLKVWRPLLPGHAAYRELFTTMWGRPFTGNALNVQFQKTVYSYTQRATNIHLVRDIWATEFIESTQNYSAAAEVLGDTVETVLRHYAHLRRVATCQQADEFIAKQVIAR